jgi:sensitive to high expression protein 9
MPPPASEPKRASVGRVEDTAAGSFSSLEGQVRLQEDTAPLQEEQVKDRGPPPNAETIAGEPLTPQPSRPAQSPASDSKDNVADNIARVPDEQLPSHRERQRWDFSKRLSELMDDLLPKLAVVTQKVNTYTGTDYSGVEALRREIQEQEKLVKARRAAIDTAKQALDTAHGGQASAQKEVVALLERKHSWSATDLERYMSLIRSEHINDQAIRQAKDRVISAEAALEEARTQLEKRERAQYHEEQIWSDTIRRNSTWVTFVLMGVNIFLLLLSLAILEPWRRRRMVREIKSALEAQRATAPTTLAAALPGIVSHDLAAIEEEIDRVAEAMNLTSEPESISEDMEQSPAADSIPVPIGLPTPDVAVPNAPLIVDEAVAPSPPSIDIAEKYSTRDDKIGGWSSRVTSIAQDIVSERVISMRRIDYTTAILQGAAAGAVITGAIIAMLRPQ